MQEVGRHSLELEPVVLVGVNLWTTNSLEEKLHGRAATVNPLDFIAAAYASLPLNAMPRK